MPAVNAVITEVSPFDKPFRSKDPSLGGLTVDIGIGPVPFPEPVTDGPVLAVYDLSELGFVSGGSLELTAETVPLALDLTAAGGPGLTVTPSGTALTISGDPVSDLYITVSAQNGVSKTYIIKLF
jgi:hypothetical protein